MSEFCEHVEAGLGWRRLTYEEGRELHRRGCDICKAERTREDVAPMREELRFDEPSAAFWWTLLAIAVVALSIFWAVVQ